jgi:FHA domain-containing protein/type VI secretion system protein
VHAKIDFREGSYYLQDVGGNPSLVNDRPLGNGREIRLAEGDRINIGEYQLLASISPEPAGLPPSPLQVEPAAAPAPSLPVNPEDSLAGASILDVGTPQGGGFDPLGVDLLATPEANPFAAPVRPAAPAFRGAESDHISPEIQAFQQDPFSTPAAPAYVPPAYSPPAHTPAAASGMAIPDDYDPLADYLPPRVSAPAPTPGGAAAPAAPYLAPAQPAAFAPAAQPVPAAPTAQIAPLDAVPPAGAAAVAAVDSPHETFFGKPAPQQVQPEPEAHETLFGRSSLATQAAIPSAVPSAPATTSASVPSAPAVIPTPAAARSQAAAPTNQTNPANDSAVLQALLRGRGISDLNSNRPPEEIAELVGAMLREATTGTMSVLMARAMTKRESRLEMTMIATQANNPLKFFPDAHSALTQMLGNALAGYMPPLRAYSNAFDDVRAHELALMAGMRAALAGVLGRFDPAAIEERLQVPTVMDKVLAANRKAKMWDRLVELYKEISSEADDDFQRLFGEKFALAYEEQIQRLRNSHR